MTKTTVGFSELLSKQDGGGFLRAVAEAGLQLIFEANVEGLTSRGKHERADQRTLNLKVPKFRQGSHFPGLLEPRKTLEKALVAVISEGWIGGVSTRRVAMPSSLMANGLDLGFSEEETFRTDLLRGQKVRGPVLSMC